MYRSARRVSRCGQDYWVTFNGEIYNVERIRQTLEEDGERFHTGTDTPITNGCFGLTAPKDSDCRGKGWEGALDAPGAAQAGRAVHAALVDRFRDGLPRLRPPLSLVYIFDDCSRECPGLLVETSIGGVSVTRFLDELAETHGPPGTIVVDNVTGFTSRAFLAWVEKHGITLRFIDPGKPNQNAFVESFNGRFRDECLDGHWFTALEDARRSIEEWRVDYNEVRPHGSLNASRRPSTEPPQPSRRRPRELHSFTARRLRRECGSLTSRLEKRRQGRNRTTAKISSATERQ